MPVILASSTKTITGNPVEKPLGKTTKPGDSTDHGTADLWCGTTLKSEPGKHDRFSKGVRWLPVIRILICVLRLLTIYWQAADGLAIDIHIAYLHTKPQHHTLSMQNFGPHKTWQVQWRAVHRLQAAVRRLQVLERQIIQTKFELDNIGLQNKLHHLHLTFKATWFLCNSSTS